MPEVYKFSGFFELGAEGEVGNMKNFSASLAKFIFKRRVLPT
jgi:hypothetical protein